MVVLAFALSCSYPSAVMRRLNGLLMRFEEGVRETVLSHALINLSVATAAAPINVDNC
jgi:hypothetical protein